MGNSKRLLALQKTFPFDSAPVEIIIHIQTHSFIVTHWLVKKINK